MSSSATIPLLVHSAPVAMTVLLCSLPWLFFLPGTLSPQTVTGLIPLPLTSPCSNATSVKPVLMTLFKTSNYIYSCTSLPFPDIFYFHRTYQSLQTTYFTYLLWLLFCLFDLSVFGYLSLLKWNLHGDKNLCFVHYFIPNSQNRAWNKVRCWHF